MHRILTGTENLLRGETALTKADLRHLRALRLEDGEAVEFFDGCGSSRVFQWSAGSGDFDHPSEIKGPLPRPRALTLFACITKGSRWDWTLEKATELGVTRIVPVLSERTIVRIPLAESETKRSRWLRIVEDAARQSDAMWLPDVLPPLSFADAVKLVAETRCYVGALTEVPSEPILAAIRRMASVPLPVAGQAVFVGPEGDFTPAELATLLRIAIPVNFGPTILRAETAAIFGVSILAAAALDYES